MGLLLLGGAAALYLRAVDAGAADAAHARAAEMAALGNEAAREREVLGSLGQEALLAAVGGGFAPGPGALARASDALQAGLAARMDKIYPRRASTGHDLNATLEFARAVALDAEADVASPYGGRSPLSVPTYLAVEGVAHVSAAGPRVNLTVLVAFSARLPLPTLLPLSIAARLAAEAGPGGRVERVAGQLAMNELARDHEGVLDAARVSRIIELALGVETALHFGASGNASLDGAIAALSAADGEFTAAELVGGPATPAEFLPAPVGTSFAVAGGQGPVTLQVRAPRFDALTVSHGWRLYDGQELGEFTWGALTADVSGLYSFDVLVSGSPGSVEVGPIRVPVAFTLRAWQGGVPDESVVAQKAVEAGIAELTAHGVTSPFAPALSAAGLLPNRTGGYEINATSRAVVVHELARSARSALPPVEDLAEFARAHAPDVAAYEPGVISIDAPLPAEGARAVLTVDGLPVASAQVEGTLLVVPKIPRGLHAIQVSLSAGGERFGGAGSLSVENADWRANISMAPALPSSFFRDALARGESEGGRAGLSVIDEAASMVGLSRPSNMTGAAEAAAYAGAALGRLAVLEFSGLADALGRERAKDAQGFLRIMIGLLSAADEAYSSFHQKPLPVGGFAGSLASLSLTSSAAGFVAASVASLKLAEAAAGVTGIKVTFAGGSAPARELHFPFTKSLLVLNALAGALTLVADAVTITKVFGANSTADTGDRVIAVTGAGVHFAKLALGVATAAYTLAGTAALAAVKTPLFRLGIAVSAAALVLDIATLYHEADGNFSLMWEKLVDPKNVGDLARLPGMVAGATAIVADLLFTAGMIGTKGGPIGVAAGLFVLAALLVANKEKVASAIFGTLPFEALPAARAQAGEALKIAFSGAAAANQADGLRVAQARRAASVSSASSWLRASTSSEEDAWIQAEAGTAASRERARTFGAFLDSAASLRTAARALAEQLDDFASPPYSADGDRSTEGYRALHTPAGEFSYAGNAVVNVTTPAGLNRTFSRPEWRTLLSSLRPEEVAELEFAFSLTDTNGIPQSEFGRWSNKVASAGIAFSLAVAEFQAAARAASP